jgi:hypothetical protein
MHKMLRGLDRQELNSVFQVWVGWVQEISQDNREYVRWKIISIDVSSAQFHQTRLAHVLIYQRIPGPDRSSRIETC